MMSVSESIEKEYNLEAGQSIAAPWQRLAGSCARGVAVWNGRSPHHLHMAWRQPPMKYGGTFEGIIAQLMDHIAIRRECHCPQTLRKVYGQAKL